MWRKMIKRSGRWCDGSRASHNKRVCEGETKRRHCLRGCWGLGGRAVHEHQLQLFPLVLACPNYLKASDDTVLKLGLALFHPLRVSPMQGLLHQFSILVQSFMCVFLFSSHLYIIFWPFLTSLSLERPCALHACRNCAIPHICHLLMPLIRTSYFSLQGSVVCP